MIRTKDAIQERNLLLPVPVRSLLPLGEKEGLAGVEAPARAISVQFKPASVPCLPPDILKATVFPRNLDDLGQTEQVDGGSAGLEDDQVRCNEEG